MARTEFWRGWRKHLLRSSGLPQLSADMSCQVDHSGLVVQVSNLQELRLYDLGSHRTVIHVEWGATTTAVCPEYPHLPCFEVAVCL